MVRNKKRPMRKEVVRGKNKVAKYDPLLYKKRRWAAYDYLHESLRKYMMHNQYDDRRDVNADLLALRKAMRYMDQLFGFNRDKVQREIGGYLHEEAEFDYATARDVAYRSDRFQESMFPEVDPGHWSEGRPHRRLQPWIQTTRAPLDDPDGWRMESDDEGVDGGRVGNLVYEAKQAYDRRRR